MRRTRWWFLVIVAMLLGAASLLARSIFADLPDPRRAGGAVGAAAPSILITDRHGQPLYELIDPNGNKQQPAPLAEIPLACRQATLATEDSRFYEHGGVDLLAILRTAWQNRRNLSATPGASTLTQQLARNLYLTADERAERSLRRKLREAWLAWQLEQRYSKDELLALYLNTTYYGHFAVGIEAAAQAYFGSHARDLDVAQCALIAGLPQYPAGYNPIENPEAARYRQKIVLGLMVKDGHLSAAQAAEAYGERLAFAASPFPIAAPHFVMWVQGQLEALLGPERLRAGGLRVTTTLDLDWQHSAEETVTRRLAQLQPCAAGAAPPQCDPAASPARRVANAALVALDPQTGAVLAMIGSPDYFDATINGALNAGLSLRQPGSAIKPLTYALALDPQRAAQTGRQPWTPATVIADLRTVFTTAEGTPYIPLNYDLTFHGPVTVRTALANSYNIPAVKALEFVGVDALVKLANQLGIPLIADFGFRISDSSVFNPQSAIANPQFGLALTLGGGEVRLLDLTAAYAALANGGQAVTPFGIERIETLEGEGIGYWVLGIEGRRWQVADGQSLTTNTQYPIPNTVLDPRAAYLITDILTDNLARLPAFGAGNALEIGRPAAAKTGTTGDWRDNWTLGYTPDLVAGVWVGNADNTPMQGVSGVAGAGPIWHDFMTNVLRNTPPQDFSRPAGLLRVEICADSGLLPDCILRNADCGFPSGHETLASQQNQSEIRNPKSEIVSCPHRRSEWFIAGTQPTEVDRVHVTVAGETIWLLPPEYDAWARERGLDLRGLRDLEGLRARGQDSASAPQPLRTSAALLTLTSPDPHQVYRLDPGLPADSQRLAITASPPRELADAGPITLLLNGQPFAAVSGPEFTAWWPLAPGRHTFQATARGGDGAEVRSEATVVLVE